MQESARQESVRMDHLCHVNGQLVPISAAGIPVYDHGLLYGDGIYEGLRAYGGSVFQLEAHLERLYRSAKAIRLTLPHTRDQLTEIVLDLLCRNGLTDAYVRIVVTR